MASELGILFLHHTTDRVTTRNLATIRRQNPRATIATLSAGKTFPRGYSLDATPQLREFHSRNVRRGSDWMVCSWFLQRRERCKKWWIVEWDTFCSISVKEYYAPVWDFPFVASSVRLLYREPEWAWFGEVKNLPTTFRRYAMGAVPFIYLLSDSALNRICRTLMAMPFFAGNGELRFSTAANFCGVPPCGFSPPGDQITWLERKSRPRGKMIFHPVKHVATR